MFSTAFAEFFELQLMRVLPLEIAKGVVIELLTLGAL